MWFTRRNSLGGWFKQMSNQNLQESFKCAFSGVVETLKSERNFKIHVIASIGAMGLGIILRISVIEFVLIMIAISMVLATEIMNTAIEIVVDLYTGERVHPLAKAAKDAAAGAVLITSVNAVGVGVAIFFVRLVSLIT